jgi:hypothetical protein
MDPRLRDEIGDAADKAGVPMNTVICDAVAKALKRPDLAAIPRLAQGGWNRKRRMERRGRKVVA